MPEDVRRFGLTAVNATRSASGDLARSFIGTMAPGESEDVYNSVPELNSARRMQLIADALAKAGHPTGRIEKILGANWLRLFRDLWK